MARGKSTGGTTVDTDECSLPSKELGTVHVLSLSRLENFDRQVSVICACEDFCDGEGTRAEDEPVVCAAERTRLGNPTGLGSPMSPCKPGFESVTDFEWTRSLGEISSPKQASFPHLPKVATARTAPQRCHEG